jgi:tyrosine-protein phosphatase SIW14
VSYQIFSVRAAASTILLWLALSSCASLAQSTRQTSHPAQQESPPTQQSMGSRKSYVGLPGFAEVGPNLYRGGQPGADGLKELKRMGVSIVIDMRGSKSPHEKVAVAGLGMRYVPIPWHCPFPKDKIFARFLKIVHDNPRTKIFVHCRLGDDRTGMAIATYRMAVQGWSSDQALKEMKEFGFKGIHPVICPTLKRYAKEFPKHLKTNPEFKDLVAAKR